MDRVRVEWGDGAVSNPVVADPPAPWSISVNHPYLAPGTYTIVITGSHNAVKTMQVTVEEPEEPPPDDPTAYGLGTYGLGTYGR